MGQCKYLSSTIIQLPNNYKKMCIETGGKNNKTK